MDIYASDDEKGEEIKQWWRDNGTSVIVGCILSVAIVLGGRYWIMYQQTNAEKASSIYQQVTSLLAEDKYTEAETKTQQLLVDYAKTPYAVFAAFEVAKQSANNHDLTSAQPYLEWVIAHAKLSGQVDIARLRLAQLLVHEAQYQPALTLLEQSHSTAFESLFAELRGDIYAAQGQQSQARSAYESALLTLKQGEPRQQLLKLKLDDVTETQDS